MTNDFKDAFSLARKVKRNKPFLVTNKRTLSYGELLTRVDLLTTVYHQAGLVAGDSVIVASSDDVEAVIFYISLLQNGIATIFLDSATPPATLKRMIQTCDTKGLILDREIRQSLDIKTTDCTVEIFNKKSSNNNLLSKLLGKNKSSCHDSSYPEILKKITPSEPLTRTPEKFDALILFTSGTTSDPKGVCLTHNNIASHLKTLSKQFSYNDQSNILNVLPLHHTDGLIQGVTLAFWNRATLYRPFPFAIQSIEPLLDCVYTNRITHFIAVPTILSLILKFGDVFPDTFCTEDFLYVISAAASLEEPLWKSFEEIFQTTVCNLYGLTETVTGSFFSGPTAKDHRYGTIGKPVDCEVRIVDEKNNNLDTNEIGELIIKGEHVMRGYLNNPEATEEVLSDGWLYTGDLASCDDEGFYRIVGRKKNTIVTGGINVQPEEVTEVLNSHPGIIDSYTFGLQNTIWGEEIVSLVVKEDHTLTQAIIVGHCRQFLPAAKVPHQIVEVESLPKGPSGKILTADAKKMFHQHISHAGVNSQDNVQETIFSITAGCFDVPKKSIHLNSSADNTPGWDSLSHLHFVVKLEKTFHIKIIPKEIMSIHTVKEAKKIVLKHINAKAISK